MYIEEQQDVLMFMSRFKDFSRWDPFRRKQIITIEDNTKNEKLSLLLVNGQWSIQRTSILYGQTDEIYLSRDETFLFIWKHRVHFNEVILDIHNKKH